MDYAAKRVKLTKCYIYKLLPDKYKSSSDNIPFTSNAELFEKMKKNNQTISCLADILGLEVIDPVNF